MRKKPPLLRGPRIESRPVQQIANTTCYLSVSVSKNCKKCIKNNKDPLGSIIIIIIYFKLVMFSLLKNPLMSLATSFDRFGWTFQRFLPMVNLEFHFFIFFAMKFFKLKKKKKISTEFYNSFIQCCGSGMIYFGSGSSFEFSEFRIQIQAKVPDPTYIN